VALRQDAFSDRGVGGLELVQLIADFRRSLLRQERAPTTVKIYDWALHDFHRFATDNQIFHSEGLSRDLIEAWQDQARESLSRNSRSIVSSALRQFLRWGAGHGHLDPRAPYWVTHVKGKRTPPRPIPKDDLIVILRYLARRRFAGSIVDLRNRALFLFILSTGARVSEALQVTRTDMTHAIVRQKGGSEKELDVPPIVLEALEEYLAERRDAYPWLWVTLDSNHPMRPLSPSSVREIWRRMALQLHIKPWTTHQLRHTGATELYEADIDGLVVANWLGHKGMSHVAQYTQVPRRRRKAALDVLQRLIKDNSPSS
jgi:integrase